MKQTAVEWAINEIQSNWYDYEYGDLHIRDVIKQAKEMEKEQIIEAYESLEHRHGENYYNETFNKSIKNKG